MKRLFDSVACWLGCLTLDSANASTVNDSDFDIACIAPVCTPGVFDDVEWSVSCISTITNGKDTVVKTGSALFRGNHTRLVELEDCCVGLDGN